MFILDTTVFINFSLGNALETLLRGLSRHLAVGPAVVERELQVWPRDVAVLKSPCLRATVSRL